MRATSPVIVGRDEEIGLLSSALDAVQRRSGRALFFVGEAGIGKSRLVGEAAYRAYGLGMPVLRGRATSTRLVVPFRPLVEALSSRFRAAGTPTDPELARIIPPWPGWSRVAPKASPAIRRRSSSWRRPCCGCCPC